MTETTKKTKAPEVSANPALVDFPSDTWGFTSELRKAGLQAASAVRGNKEKQDLFLATIRTLAQHSLARFDGDKAELAQRLAEIEEHQASAIQRQFSNAPVEAPAAEQADDAE